MFEAYSVAVRISLINGVTSGLMNVSRSFAKVHGDAAKLQRQLDAIKFKVVAGAALAGTGFFGLSLIGKTLPYAKEYSRQLALMNTLGMKQADIARVVGQAWKSSYAVPTTTAAQNLATFRELRSAFGSDSEAQGHAAAMMPVVGRLAGVMQSITGRPQEHVGFDMVKAIELRTGVMTTEALMRNSEMMSRAIVGMAGTITAQDFHGTLKMGKMATNKWSDDFVYNYLPTLMQELKTSGGGNGGGAQTAGTALMSLYQQMHGRMTKAAMPLWVEAGLVKPSDIVKNATGNFQMKPGSVAGTSLFEQNPYLWVQQYLRPGVERLSAKRGISEESAINSMFSNRNAAFAAYNMLFKAAQYDRDKTTIGKADGGFAAYQKLLKSDPNLAQAALAAQWQNVLAQIGYSIMPTLVRGTLMLMNGLKGLSAAMREHPGLTRALVIGFAGLSAAMAFGGTVILLSAAFSAIGLALGTVGGMAVAFGGVMTTIGAIVVGVTLPLALAVAGLAALGVAIFQIVKHWDASKGIIENIKSELGGFFMWLLNKARGLIGLQPLDPNAPKAKSNQPWHPFEGSLDRLMGSSHVATSHKSGAGSVGDVHIDGQKVGKVIWRLQSDGYDRVTAASGAAFDPRMALTPVSARY